MPSQGPLDSSVMLALTSLSRVSSDVMVVAPAGRPRSPWFVSAGIEALVGHPSGSFSDDPALLDKLTHPDDRHRVERELAAWNRTRDPLLLRYRLVASDGRVVHCREQLAPAAEGPRGWQVQGLIADATELAVLEAAAVDIDPGAALDDALDACCDRLASTLALDASGHLLRESPSFTLLRHAQYGERLSRTSVRASQGWLVAAAVERRQLVVSSSASGDAVHPSLGPSRGAFAVPIVSSEGALQGVLWGRSQHRDGFDARERRLITAVALHAARAIAQAALLRQLERTGAERRRLAESVVMAHEDERRRIATELHDGAGQTLMASVIQIDLATHLVGAHPASQALHRARSQVEQTLEDLRGLAHALRPAALDKLGLPEALREMGRALSGSALTLDVEVPTGDLGLEPEIATAVFRIAQAALTNVARHARALHAMLRLSVDENSGRLVLVIEDDGQGISRRSIEGIGLVAMRERAAAIGGELFVETRPEGGTRVRAEIPLPSRTSRDASPQVNS
jgi:signal transduction histidine kinase